MIAPTSYKVIIWWSAEEEAYVAEVPELPGWMAHGENRAAALAHAGEAIAFWSKGMSDTVGALSELGSKSAALSGTNSKCIETSKHSFAVITGFNVDRLSVR